MGSVKRMLMRQVNTLAVRTYRRSGGRRMGRAKGMPVLLLTVPGRRTGVPHTVPVVYLADAGGWIVTRSGGGMRDEPQWFRNLRASDSAVIEVGARRHEVAVTVTDAGQHAQRWQQLISTAPFFDKYQQKVTRTIPIAVLTPR